MEAKRVMAIANGKLQIANGKLQLRVRLIEKQC